MIRNSKHNNRFLLYIDLLGFSVDIMKSSLKESKIYYQDFLETLKEMNEIHKKLRFSFVSDSAFLWIGGANSEKNIRELFEVAMTLYHNSIFSQFNSIRGSIIYDEFEIAQEEFTLGKSKITSPVIIGKGIVSAYRWEQTQNWLGISIHPIYIENINKDFPELLNQFEKLRLINNYNVPTKAGHIETYSIGLHTSHIIGYYEFPGKGTHRNNFFTKIMKVNTYESLLISKRKNQRDFSVLNKITETLNYVKFLKDKNLGRNDGL
jgi:hypothetical protein